MIFWELVIDCNLIKKIFPPIFIIHPNWLKKIRKTLYASWKLDQMAMCNIDSFVCINSLRYSAINSEHKQSISWRIDSLFSNLRRQINRNRSNINFFWNQVLPYKHSSNCEKTKCSKNYPFWLLLRSFFNVCNPEIIWKWHFKKI